METFCLDPCLSLLTQYWDYRCALYSWIFNVATKDPLHFSLINLLLLPKFICVWVCISRGFWTANLAKPVNPNTEKFFQKLRWKTIEKDTKVDFWRPHAHSHPHVPTDTNDKMNKTVLQTVSSTDYPGCLEVWEHRICWLHNHLSSQCAFTGLYSVKSKGTLCFCLTIWRSQVCLCSSPHHHLSLFLYLPKS